MKKIIVLVTSVIVLCLFSLSAEATPIFINEIHYDNLSTDVGEGVEIAGPAGTDLTSWSILLYNGSSSQLNVYDSIEIHGILPDLQNGFGMLAFATPGIQNGTPDGIALVNSTGSLIQFLSYEGIFTPTSGPASGITSTDIGISETSSSPIGYSLQLSGTGSDSLDFTWDLLAINSMGMVNQDQVFMAAPQDPSSNPVAPVPEPATLLLFACGLILTLGLRKLRSVC